MSGGTPRGRGRRTPVRRRRRAPPPPSPRAPLRSASLPGCPTSLVAVTQVVIWEVAGRGAHHHHEVGTVPRAMQPPWPTPRPRRVGRSGRREAVRRATPPRPNGGGSVRAHLGAPGRLSEHHAVDGAGRHRRRLAEPAPRGELVVHRDHWPEGQGGACRPSGWRVARCRRSWATAAAAQTPRGPGAVPACGCPPLWQRPGRRASSRASVVCRVPRRSRPDGSAGPPSAQ